MIVVTGQVWTAKGDNVPHVVVGLTVPIELDEPIGAQLVRVWPTADPVPYSFIEIPCDALRDAFDLVYDATLIEPYNVGGETERTHVIGEGRVAA